MVAYIGPGPGLSMLTALLGLLGTVLLAIVAIFFQPLRILWRKMRNKDGEAAQQRASPTEESDEAADGSADQADEDRDVA